MSEGTVQKQSKLSFSQIGLLALLVILLAACNLDSAEQAATETPAPTNTLPPIDDENPTSVAQSSNTPVATQSTGGSGSTGECTPRKDWKNIYIVRSGDTLTRIATNAGITAETLAGGNCIEDVNNIFVGQQIRLPGTATGSATATFGPPLSQDPPEKIGGAMPSEIISGDAGFVSLVRDSAITLFWEEPPANIAKAAFFVFPSGWTFDHAGEGTIEIGEDTNGSDGWSVSWSVPASVQGELVAFGYGDNGRLEYYSWPLVVSSALPATTACRIRPVGAATVPYREDPQANSPVAGTFNAANAVPILGRSLSGWYAISTNAAFSGVGGVDALKWVAPDAQVAEEGDNC